MTVKEKTKMFFNYDTGLEIVLLAGLALTYFGLLPQKMTGVITAAIGIIATIPVIISAIKSIAKRKINIDLLASIALAASIIQREWTSILFINLMITSARIFSDYTESRSRRAIEHLMKLKPQKARVKRGEEIIELPIEKLKSGDIILSELGERIPVDGIIEKGEAEVDQSSLTGVSIPVSKKTGEKVLSSTIIVSGSLEIRAEKIGKETAFEKVIEMVESSQENKAPITTLGEKFSRWYIFITLAGAILVFIFSKNASLVLAVLLVACADDVAVAIPLAFLTSIAHSAKHGAVVKGGNFIEALAQIKVIITDKTGTLTRGKLKVEKIFAFNGKTEKDTARAASAVALLSDHPTAQAVKRYIKIKNITVQEPSGIKEYSGKGAIAEFQGKKITTGKMSFFEELGIKISEDARKEAAIESEKGFIVMFVAEEKEFYGFITLSDEVRAGAKEAISELKKLGVQKIVMLTGDNKKIAERVADEVGIEEYHANLMPEDKINYLKQSLNKKYKTAMLGDGVNDAATLGLADVGIAMGVIGSDAAIEAADIALMRDDIKQVPELIKIGKTTMRVVKQDLLIWGAINVIGLVLVFGRVIGPEGAAAYNFLTDFLPLFNSLRLFR
ncbi:MAG: cation-translocating P-type ATPase [Candidatus Azambacteria bacterium]|nr:cation-translocating P-type ATPase [Candidatus Azambacteria bacterium]